MILLDTYIWVNWILLGRDALKPAIASAIEKYRQNRDFCHALCEVTKCA